MISDTKIAKQLNGATTATISQELGLTSNTAVKEDLIEGNFNQSEAQALAKESLDYLSAVANPEGHLANFPPTYQACWTLLLTYIHMVRDFSKLAIGLPRGFGKTTFMKLFVLYVLLFTDRKFILIVAANAKLASNIVADICDFLDTPNIKAIFGDWRLGLEKDTQELKKFGFRGRNIILAAIGESGSVRGFNLKNSRPDVMIFDDIQTREDADSAVVSEAIYTKMLGTTMKAKAPTGCLYLFLANMYPTKHSILRKLKSNPSWIKFIAGGILANGESLWEDVQPLAQLLEEFENDLNSGHPEIFYSEVLNDETASVNTAIDITKIPNYTEEALAEEISAGNFIIIDPSNDKANSDAVSIGQFSVINGVPVLRKLMEGKYSPGDTIRHALKLALQTGTQLIVVEANAYQYSALYWFEKISAQLGLSGIQFEPIYSGARSKNSRILDMFKQLTAVQPELKIADGVRSTVLTQISQFNPLRTDNVDGILDLLTYAPRVLAEMPDKLVINSQYGTDYEGESADESGNRCTF